jgi:hypothetical protein
VDDPEYLTEAQAAEMIGWGAANLRSHRLRHEAERIAAALPEAHRRIVLAVRSSSWAVEPVLAGYEGPGLFRMVPETRMGAVIERRWTLSQQGLEVARRIGQVSRRSPAPPRAEVQPGRVRYRRSDVLDWLDANPQVADRTTRRAETWGYRETARVLGIVIGTLRTLVSRAQVAQRSLSAGEPDPGGWLAYQIERVPPWTWAGAERRWIPQQVRAWMERHRPEPDPLEIQHDPARGRLLSEPEAQALMGVSDETMRGYRARARAALGRLAVLGRHVVRPAALPRPLQAQDVAGQRPVVRLPAGTARPIWEHARPRRARDHQRARAHPPYVIRDGARWFHERDVRDWAERRGQRD